MNGPAPWWLRALFVVLGLAGWFSTQSLIGRREFPPGILTDEPETRQGTISDTILDLLAGCNRYLHNHSGAANLLLVCSSAVIDVLGVFLLGMSIFGETVRPFLGLLIVFVMRQCSQMICGLPKPPGLIWHHPTLLGVRVPSLLVTYGVSTDFFFSGHTALAVVGAWELVQLGGPLWLMPVLLITCFECGAVLVLRAHYTLDVFTGIVAALLAALLAERWAPWCDAWLAWGAQQL